MQTTAAVGLNIQPECDKCNGHVILSLIIHLNKAEHALRANSPTNFDTVWHAIYPECHSETMLSRRNEAPAGRPSAEKPAASRVVFPIVSSLDIVFLTSIAPPRLG